MQSFGIESIAANAVSSVFGWLIFLMFSAVGKLIALLATGLYYVINIPVYPDGGVAVIDESWKIMRNFANMFFIIALIVMAFATIFNITKYEARTLFPKFLISALLINFSLVLGVSVIDASQILSNTFLVSIGDMSDRLGQGLVNSLPMRADQISANTVANALDGAVFGTIITLIFSVVLLFTFAFSLLTAFLFALIRIPILWALLVVSPIAWILNVFPAGQGTYKKWWKLFIGWNMFLPIFLFFLYFGLYFLQSQGDVLSKIAAQTANQPLGGSSFTLQILFYYVLAAIFLIGGTITAMKASMFSGTGVVGVAKWSRGVAARRLGLTAAGRAAKGRYEEYKEGRQAQVERGTARFRDIIGGVTFGRRGFQEEQLAKDVTAGKKKFERITDPAQLRSLMEKGPNRDRLAAMEILKDRKLLTERERRAGYELYEKNSPLGAKQFARSLDYDKMSGEERKGWLGRVPDIETQQKITNAMADKGDRYLTNTEEGAEQNLNKILGLFGLEGEQRDLLKKIEKHNFELSIKVGLQNQLLMKAGKVIEDTPEGLRTAMEEAISRMNPDALLEATRSLTDFANKSPENNKLVLGALNQQKIEAMMAKGTEAQLTAWKTIDDRFDAGNIKREKERVAKELAEITGKASGEAIAKELGRGGGGGGTSGGTPPPVGFRPTTPPPPPRSQAQPTAPGNVVDLRSDERRSRGGIILTPGTQFEMEKEEKERNQNNQ
ncbi:MAG: hypothetical protein HYT66_00470 [Candidatus Yanofskybacteria bacterium]|nr:hypothetical protein [Candidatus Yanofskybacteria bacterium]